MKQAECIRPRFFPVGPGAPALSAGSARLRGEKPGLFAFLSCHSERSRPMPFLFAFAPANASACVVEESLFRAQYLQPPSFTVFMVRFLTGQRAGLFDRSSDTEESFVTLLWMPGTHCRIPLSAALPVLFLFDDRLDAKSRFAVPAKNSYVALAGSGAVSGCFASVCSHRDSRARWS